jgi:putative ABC transport system permease protein
LLVALVALCLGLVAWQAVRKPVLRRLALRDAIRRPSETSLVIAGSLLGTALITGSLIVGDTLDASIKATAATQLGPVDEIVAVPESDRAEGVLRSVEDIDDRRIDGVMSLVATEASFASDESGRKLAEPEGQLIEVDFEEGLAFGADRAATGLSGDTPRPGRIVLGEDLAGRLEVGEDDEVTVYLYGEQLDLTVDRVLPRTGLAGFWLGIESTSPNAFVSPGTIADLTAGGTPMGAVPPVAYVLVSNRGGVEDGADLTGPVTRAMEDVLGTSRGLRVEPVKEETLSSAQEQGDQFGELFLGIGSFAVVAGVLLLVNIFVMLSEERKSQLGMLRAVGMRRSHLVRTFVIEGAVYALGAGILGAVLGIGVGWAIARLAAPIFGGADDFSLELRFAIESHSLVSGFCGGILISLLTILGTSLRISRINIIRAIRDLPEPPARRVRARTMLLGLGVAAISLAWFVSGLGDGASWAGAILGPPLVAFGLFPAVSRVVGRRITVVAAALFSLVWGIFGNAILDGGFYEEGEIFSFVVSGILLTLSAVVLLTQAQENFESGIRKIAARNLPLRLSVAYPLARRFRTGLTLGMFALVIFTMTFIAVLSNLFGGQVDAATRKEGGFDLLVTASASNPPPPELLESQDGVRDVAFLLTSTALFAPPGFAEPEPWAASGIDEEFVEGGPPALSDRTEDIESDEDVWRELLRDPNTAVVPTFFLQEGGGPPTSTIDTGDVMSVVDPVTGARAERRVIGKVENDFAFSGVYMSKSSLEEVAGDRASRSRFYVETAGSPERARDVARRMQGRLVANGVEAETFRGIVESLQNSNLQFFELMQSYLALGLVVGIAGLGVLMVRAVRERRRDVGVLRSLGFVPRQVRTAFVMESGVVAAQGIVVGLVLALITASQLVATGEFGQDLVFEIPWRQLSIVSVVALVASLLATAWPAQQASQIPPAVALRIAE